MSDRIMRCEKCKKQTIHIKEGRRFQIRCRIEIYFKCKICGTIVKIMSKKPGNSPRGTNWGWTYR